MSWGRHGPHGQDRGRHRRRPGSQPSETYAHATPLDDQDVADNLDHLLNRATCNKLM